jgi:signal transduction histidine kinase
MARSVSGVRATALLGQPENTQQDAPLAVSCEPHDAQIVDAALSRIVQEHDHDGVVPVDLVLDEDLGAIVIPLRAHLAQAGALVALFDPVHAPPGVEERELLASFADQAGLALDRAQAVVDRGELAVISDRERIARDLHDVVIQRLFATGLQLQGVASLVGDPAIGTRLERAVDELDLTIKAIRGTIFELQHKQGDSLRAEIRGLVREYVPVLGFSPVVLTSGPIDTAVPTHVREQLLPVLREAVSNVARHALADQAQVEVHVSDHELRLSLVDDGIGLAADRSESGLRNVRRRAAGLGGSVTVTRNQPRGTTLVWQVPLAASTPPSGR